jgi:hypothetical protein
VRLRLIFDEPRNPDFILDLWLPEDETRKGSMNAAEAIQEANRWIARVESLLRRPVSARPAPALAAPPPAPRPARPAPTVRADPAPEPPPWEDDEPEAIS